MCGAYGEKRVGCLTNFLLELRSEEIPARMQVKAKDDLARLFAEEIGKEGLVAQAMESFATPRRIALIARGLPPVTQNAREERKGPRANAPEAALAGFLRSTGLSREQLTERGGVLFAVIDKPGRPTPEVLAEAIPAIVRGFPWPKSMRWGASSISTESLRWVRPLQGIVALFGEEIVHCEVDGIVSGAATIGHRFHHSGPVNIGSAEDYVEQLRAAHVIVHLSERRALIEDGAARAAAAGGLTVIPDEGLVIENAGLTEWPVPLLGRFDAAFLELPREVIQLTMRTNQKYFACADADCKLGNAFICTANIEASDGGAAVIAGNEKVLSARLSDAKFFFEQDMKVSLENHAAKLSQIVFHEKLGTVADKVDRVAKLARWLVETKVIRAEAGDSSVESAAPDAHGIPACTGMTELADMAKTAAELCKADLVTGMVGEFPELQGVMGGYYARAQGYPDAVADAIRDHYKPVGQSDEVPTAPVTVAVSLADKLDTIASFFGVAMPPTGSKDPFALRRATLGAILLIVENKLRLELSATIRMASRWLLPFGYDSANVATIDDFIADRLKVQQREAGVRHDLIDAVFALGGEDDLVRLLARVKALQGFVGTDEGRNLLAGYKRAANILKKEVFDTPEVQASVGKTEVEQGLSVALRTAEPLADAAIEAEDFGAAMSALASLRPAVDAFFEGVMVNDPDPAIRAYRLWLLARFRDAVHKVADFSKIEV